MKIFSFEELIVWQKPRALSKVANKTTKLTPEDECVGLNYQTLRCSISVSSNIDEEKGRHASKGKARFTEIAYGSALELIDRAIFSNDLKCLSDENYKENKSYLTEITPMLDSLYKSQLKA